MRKKDLVKLVGAAAFAVSMGMAGVAHAQPSAPEEFRGTWVTTAWSLDWPVGTGDSPQKKRADFVSMLDTVQAAGFNAILFQIRSEGDAMYVSEYEPWSRYFNGGSGVAPPRPWDPLQFAIDEARRRGLEVHAWVNPYRAGVSQSASYHSTHPVNTNPNGIVVPFTNTSGSSYYWFNPGNPHTRTYTRQILMDIVDRYDIDALHIDDYFYPYGINNTTHPFPDSAEYSAYGGSMTLGDWRRENVNLLMQEIYDDIRNHPEKDHVRFGISPFGIWRPNNPPGISGLDAYASIYADSRKWQQQGWGDYFAPQIYWGRAADGYSPAQDFDSLLGWWTESTQNPLGRHVWPGHALYKMAASEGDWPASQIINQINVVQANPGSKGSLYFRTIQLTANSGAGTKNITTAMANGPYNTRALPPATTWIDNTLPSEPSVAWSGTPGSGPITTYWEPEGNKYPQWYIVYYSSNSGSTWSHIIVPDWQRRLQLPGTGASTPTHIAVQAVDRLGNRSAITTRNVSSASPTPPPALDFTVLADFEDGSAGSGYMWFTGSSSSANVTSILQNATTLETNNRRDPRSGNPGSLSSRVRFDWTQSSGGFLRLSTFNGAVKPNPAIDLSRGLGFYFKLLEGELDLRLFIRETGGSGPIGSDGGSSGPIEMTSAQRLTASPSWQYVYIDIPNEDYESFSGGNGTLDGSWGVMEALGIYQVASSPVSSFEIYFDDFHQGEPLTALGEPRRPRGLAGTAGTESIALQWDPNTEIDLRGYRVYRSTSSGVTPDAANFITEVNPANSYNDTGLTANQTYYYVITAIDHFDNESFPSFEFSATALDSGDTTPPTSSASATVTVTNNPSLTINFTASDDDSGVASVELFVKTPTAGSFTSTGLTETGTSGSFNYTAAAGDGDYEFYTIATDNASNVEAAPAGADVSILLDTVPPTSSASATVTVTNDTTLAVNFSAGDGASGVTSVELFVKTPTAGSFTSTGLTETGTSGSFNYTATAGDGDYEFYTIATDNASNVEAAPAGADVSILLDTEPPMSGVAIADPTQVVTVNGTFTASDAGSGIDFVTLFVRPMGGSWSPVGTISGGTWSHAPAEAGLYGYRSIATDNAGNEQIILPAGGVDAIVWFNPTTNGPMSLDITDDGPEFFPLVEGGPYIFPMTDEIDFQVSFEEVTEPGSLTVQRVMDNTGPTGYDADRFVNEHYALTAGGGLAFLNASLNLAFDTANIPAGLTLAEINRAFRDDAGTVTEFAATVTDDDGIASAEVTGVDSFSSWFLGDPVAGFTGWLLLGN